MARKSKIPSTERSPRPLSPTAFAVIAGIGLFIALTLLFVFIYTAPELTRYGIGNNVFYVLLFPLGLAAAAFLFGAMNSWAVYREKRFAGSIELGGPIVGAALTVLGGFFLIPPISMLQVVVRPIVSDQRGVQLTDGSVTIDFGVDRRDAPLSRRGEASFLQVPNEYRARPVRIVVQAPGYTQSEPDKTYDLSAGAVYVEMRRTPGNSLYPHGLEKVYASSADVQASIRELVSTAEKEIVFIGLNFHISAADRFDLLKKRLHDGVVLRYIVIHPFTRYLEEVARNEDMTATKLRDECIEGLTTVLYLRKQALQENAKGRIDIRFLEWPPNFRAYVFDPGRDGGRTVIVPYLQGVKSPQVPALVITNNAGSALYGGFSKSADHLAKRSIDLAAFLREHGSKAEFRDYL